MLNQRPSAWLISLGFFLLGLLLLPALSTANEPTKLLRFPDLHGDQVVFTYAGDLWLAPSAGGTARRLTSHPGAELFAKFSPDGRWIAFTGQYDGDEQVYVVSAEGGVPKQLTFYPAQGPLPPRWGYDNQVHGWSPDGSAILFRSLRDGWDLGDGKLFTVPAEGGLSKPLPMPEAGAGDFSPDGKKIVYSPLFRDFRHWKRYEGGWAQDLYVFDLATNEVEQVTKNVRTDRDPMWVGSKIYWSSDRTGTLNLYSYDLASRATEQLTRFDRWDLRWPSADAAGSRIVFELAGELQVFDTASGQARPIAISVPDDGVAKRPARISAAGTIENTGLSPKGERAVFAARGDVFSVPIEHGPTRNLTRSSGAHDRSPAWSPDGKKIAYVSDASGEDDVYVVDQDGSGTPERLTQRTSGRIDNLLFSPDGKQITYSDQQGKLYLLDLASKESVEIADDKSPFGLDPSWSPDSRYLAVSLADDSGLRSLWIHSLGDRKMHRVTDELWNEVSPSWSPDGKHLFYLSDHEFAPQLGGLEFNYVPNRQTSIFGLTLKKDGPSPVPLQSDEVGVEEEKKDTKDDKDKKDKKDKDKKKEAEEEDEKVRVEIDFEGLAERVTRIPVGADNYQGLQALEGKLLYVKTFAPYYGRESEAGAQLRLFTFEDRHETTLVEELESLAVSQDGSKALMGVAGQYRLIEISSEGAKSPKTIATDKLAVDRVPAEEWVQIFDEVWRRFRDYFYVSNMHGYDWQALREQYRPLLAHVAHRSDLNYVITEMIAELNVSHAYVAGGDFAIPKRPKSALLGARFELDEASGRYRFSEIFKGQNSESVYRSPLTEVGVGVEVGDYLLRVNGVELVAGDNPERLLRHAGASTVELTVNSRPSFEGARQVSVEPIESENDLLYLRWIERNRRWVDEHSQGRVGYLHIPDMGEAGIREFIKWFYGQIRKQGLIIDVRSNGGGNVSQMIIERLRREVLMMDYERNSDLPDTYPASTFHGHLVCLLDEDTASDGDQFSYVFRAAGLGPLVGKRSWGGVVGIYGRAPLIDGGSVSVPEAGSADSQGRWVIEGHGVDPDVVVENEPKQILAGRDQQLEKGLELVLEKIAKEPKTLPGRPEPPIKTEPAH